MVVKSKDTEIDSLAKTNRLLQDKIRELTTDLDKEKVKNRKGAEEKSQLVAEAKVMKKGILTYEQKISELNQKQTTGTDEGSLKQLTDLVATKFEEVEKSLKLSILTEVDKCNKKFEEKIEEVVSINKSYAESVTNTEGSSTTNRPAVTSPPDFRSIIREEENEKLADETDKKRRACNIIVHGVAVSTSDDKDQAKQHDKDLVTALIRDLGHGFDSKSVFRLGNGPTKRPIKVTFNSEDEKNDIMNSLRNLKGKEQYKGVSVTDDHTLKDRELIKEWTEKAKSANNEEPSDSVYEWKVRGSPKNGLSLRKFRKRDPQVQV